MADNFPDKNLLGNENSPYLLQHADNPVHWYPWGEKAFQKARQEDKPVFLSIGYATCHWCHVMAHESFEDSEIARLLNEHFVNIKVDREERPAIDHTYMTICQMLTGRGGWPLSLFITPDKKPFYAATYIPKTGRHGRPGLRELVPRISEMWKNKRERITGSADEITGAFQKANQDSEGNFPSENLLHATFEQFRRQYDDKFGGFGDSPKFPAAHNLMFLLKYWKQTGEEEALEMVEHTLDQMRLGGMYDQVGFGFHRYSTDRQWLVPHFEKMLYDQAMLALIFTDAWQVTGKPLYRQTAREILRYTTRDLRSDDGAFYSAEDADSEGEEGKFYVWSMEEIREVLDPEEAELAIKLLNISKKGNYKDEASGQRTGNNILHLEQLPESEAHRLGMEQDQLKEQLGRIRKKLFRARNDRVRPFLDDKILTDWNGLMIAALSKAGRVFNSETYIEQAKNTEEFLSGTLTRDDPGLMHRYRDGDTSIPGHADDYAFYIFGLLELYDATFHTPYLQKALKLQKEMDELFWDPDNGGYYFTSSKHDQLLGRKKEVYDGALPSGNSIAMGNLLRLERITSDTSHGEKSDRMGRVFSEQVHRAPTGFAQMLQSIQFALESGYEIVLSGERGNDKTRQFIRELNTLYLPHSVRLFNDPGDSLLHELAPFTRHQNPVDGEPTVYVCRDYHCKEPLQDPVEMRKLLSTSG